MNILYFGFDMFSPCLEYLISQKHNILKIYSFESDGYFDFFDNVKKLADENNIEFTLEKITAAELMLQSKKGIDLIFCAGYAYRIPIECLNGVRAINLHPSLLPQGRGPWPLPWAILNHQTKTGVTAHILAPKIDEGDILLQKEIDISKSDDYFSLEKKITQTAASLVKELFENLEQCFENKKAQQKGEYLPEPPDEMRTIYDDMTDEEKNHIIRAFGKAYIINGGKRNVY